MRTYTRKRLGYQEIEDVHELCRLCLEKPEESVPLFTGSSDSVCSLLALRIMICVGLEMTKEDSLPNIICVPCLQELEKYYTFRKKCEVSYQKLKSHMLAVKEKNAVKDAERKRQQDELNVVKIVDNGYGKQNLIFTVNPDGSIQLCDSNNSLNGRVSVFTLMKVPNLEPETVQNHETIDLSRDILDFNETELRNGEQAIEKSVILTDNNVVEIVKCAESSSEPNTLVLQDNTPNNVLASFLTTMLLEQKIIIQNNDNIVLDLDTRTIELETGDGNQITFELIEEDEQMDERFDALLTVKKEDSDQKDETIKQNMPNLNTFNGKDMPAKGRAWCSLCRKSYGGRSVLVRHMREVHAGARPHACADCGKRFAQKAVLTRHKLTHQENRPFQCTQCPKNFTQRSSLESHRRVHTPPDVRGLRIHRCSRCPKVFLHASGLSRHMIIHTGKTFKCLCGRPFKDKSSLLRHSRSMRCQRHERAVAECG